MKTKAEMRMRYTAALSIALLLSTGTAFLRAGETPNIESFDDAVAVFTKNDFFKAEAAAKALAAAGETHKGAVLGGLNHSNADVRRYSAIALEHWKALDDETIRVLTQRLDVEREAIVRCALVDALRFSKSPLALPPLLAIFDSDRDDGDLNTRSSAAMGINQLPGDRRVKIAAFIKVLKDKEWHVVTGGSQGLWRLKLNEKDCEFAEALAAVVRTAPEPQGRVSGLRYYLQLKTPPGVSVELATAALSDPSADVRAEGARALAKLAPHSALAQDALRARLSDSDFPLRADVCLALFKLGQDPEPLVRVLCEIIRAEKGNEKYKRNGLDRTLEVLREMKSAGAGAASDLIALGHDFDGVIWTLQSMGPAIRSRSPELVAWLKMDSAEPTNSVLNALFDIGVEPSCVPRLRPYLKHPDAHARKMTQFILEGAERAQD